MAKLDWEAALPAGRYSAWSTQEEIYVPMRDGVRLSTDLFLPEGASGQLPAILIRTPYEKETDVMVSAKWIDFFLRQGYAVVLQNERGTFLSEGDYGHLFEGAGNDGYDTIEWIVSQPWSNGRVGTLSCSSAGELQLPLAAANHPAHAAMVPGSSGMAVGNIPGNDTRGAFYRGGVPFDVPLWAGWFASTAFTERLLVPPDSTEEQRVRLRKRYFLRARPGFNAADPANLMHLPSGDLLRKAGGPLSPWEQYITWTPSDPGWDLVEHVGDGADPRVPALHVSTWHDVAITETTRFFRYLQDRGTPDQYLIVGAGGHSYPFYERPFEHSLPEIKQLARSNPAAIERIPSPNMADLKLDDLEAGDARYRGVDHGWAKLFLGWFAHWLAGEENDILDMPKVQLYVMGQGWLSGETWPLEGTEYTTYYLGSEGEPQASGGPGTLTSTPPGRDVEDTYVYDPNVPVPSLGAGFGNSLTARDQREIEARKDVLVYRTPPLEEPITIAGPLEVVLYVSSSAKDTDFMVKLIDVYPDGKSVNLSDDAFRVRYRDGFDKPAPMQPGEVYEIRLSNMTTAVRFGKGHRIQLDISSSNFPLYERNLNTGNANHAETQPVSAVNTVHHGPEHQSHVVLPIVPG